jgi:hypothetical protein
MILKTVEMKSKKNENLTKNFISPVVKKGNQSNKIVNYEDLVDNTEENRNMTEMSMLGTTGKKLKPEESKLSLEG